MTGRNYDYLPDDTGALKDEIARLDQRIAELEGERDAVVERAVNEEREACAKVAESIIATFAVTQSTLGVQGHIAAAIRSRP
jgi:cell division septum initiation protein DivIVA